MASARANPSSFDVLDGDHDDPLLSAAAAAASVATATGGSTTLVVIVRPDDPDHHHVVAGGGTGVLRAAVSVAVGAGNDRLWRDAPHLTTDESSPRSLPEVVATAADAAGVRRIHTGCVRRSTEAGTARDVVAIWFETDDDATCERERTATLEQLKVASERAAERRAELARAELARISANGGGNEDAQAEDTRRTFDESDPTLDPASGLYHAAYFQQRVDDFDADEANLLLVDIDDFDTLVSDLDTDATAELVRLIGDRLVGNCRAGDLIARVTDARFAVLFDQIGRSEVMSVAKRLVIELSHPFHLGSTEVTATATIALASQAGLVDMDELIELADAAVASSRRAGGGRLVLAA